MIKIKKPELLIPARDLDVLKTAIIYGADAVYIGGDMYGLRAKAKNFSLEEMEEGIAFAHEYGKKVYVTANISAHNDDISGMRKYFEDLKAFGENRPDGVIISDPGVFALAKEIIPEVELHISTQANSTNYETYKFWHSLGATRVVSARELSLKELSQLRSNIPDDMDIETFVHGAMCIAYSGRCLLSNYFTGRDANKGACTHSCRWRYHIVEETRPGEFLPIEEDERGTYIFNSKDLCMIEYIPEIVHAGINSLKVEGRMKNALYVATVAKVYRAAIDDYFDNPETYENNKENYMDEIKRSVHRQFTTGFFFDIPTHEDQIYDTNTYEKPYTYLGTIEDDVKYGLYGMAQKNKFTVGETIEILRPKGENMSALVKQIMDEDGKSMENCPHPQQKIYVDLGITLNPYDILRRKEG